VMHRDGVSFGEAVGQLAARAGLPFPGAGTREGRPRRAGARRGRAQRARRSRSP
jgi:DNA primase